MTRITVVGTGSQQSEPDAAAFSILAPAVAQTAREALAASSQLANSALELLKDAGIPDADRGVQFSEAHRETRWDGDREIFVGWRSSHQVSCISRDIAASFALLEALTTIDGINVRGPHWQIDADNPAHAAARHAAVIDARSKAADYAAALGVELDQLIEITEQGASPSPVRVEARLSMAAPALEAAAQTINASVTAVFSTL